MFNRGDGWMRNETKEEGEEFKGDRAKSIK